MSTSVDVTCPATNTQLVVKRGGQVYPALSIVTTTLVGSSLTIDPAGQATLVILGAQTPSTLGGIVLATGDVVVFPSGIPPTSPTITA